MKPMPSSVFILIMFVSVYIFCVSTYTFIAALNNVNLWIHKENKQKESNKVSRLKRGYTEKQEFINVQLSDSWKTNITLNICCKENEYLNSKFECIKLNATTSADVFEKALLLSDVVVVDENLTQNYINMSRLFLKYNTGKFCPSDEIIVITWPPDTAYSYYISQKDGHILELSDDRKSVTSNFSTSSYCLNQMTGDEIYYAALLCPCNEKLCIQKCCKKGSYYNIRENSCKEEQEDNVKSYEPTFYENNRENNENISYRLIHSGNGPNCSGPDKLIDNGSESSPLYIQKNGQLMVILEQEKFAIVVDKKQYCVDVFSEGNLNSSYINGFYCQNDIGLEIVTTEEEIDGNEREVPIVKAFLSSDNRYVVNLNLFIMVLSILFFIM